MGNVSRQLQKKCEALLNATIIRKVMVHVMVGWGGVVKKACLPCAVFRNHFDKKNVPFVLLRQLFFHRQELHYK